VNPIDAIYILAVTLGAPFWARKPRQGWNQRMGHVGEMLEHSPGPAGSPESSPQTPTRPRILLHAVSVGEVNALRPLVPLLTPHAHVIVCTTTDTGLARAQQLFAQSASVVRYPLDFSWAVRRFLNHVRPDVVGLVELELWPNFLSGCRRRGIPACVINGRLSQRSFKGYRRWSRVVRPLLFSRLAHAAVQEPDYADRFTAMGTPSVAVTGSMKWDSFDVSGGGAEGGGAGESPSPSAEAMALGLAMGLDPNRPLIVAGSTGPGEEELLHKACPDGVQLACAPRKPERFAQAAAAMPGSVRRSEAGQPPPSDTPPTREAGGRFVLDTIGELGLLYQLADVVVVGRSFFDLYGSDPIEPIAMGKPVVIGPAVSDFATIVATFEDADAIVPTDREGLASTLASLLADPARRAGLAQNGLACIRAQQGAASGHAELLLGLAGSASR
jgi:3-deoxy-D-manno-octulosonic-acid transferase